jgi:nitrite reductase (NADH) small subunit
MSVAQASGQVVEVKLCTTDELPDGMGRAFEVAGHSIAVFRTRSGELYAVENTCPHRGGPLADGIVAGDRIVCPMHGRRFKLSTGCCDDASVCDIKQFDVRVHQKTIILGLPRASQS